MLKPILTPRDIAERYNRFMPEEVRQFLKSRGIAATLIDRLLLGWNGKRITMPIFGDSTREVLGFRYAMLPKEPWDNPDVVSERGVEPELYGRETLARRPHRVVICEGEFDRLLLESRGFPAVTSTAGASTFLPEWGPLFEGIDDVFICFRRSVASDAAAKFVQRIIPRARIATLPAGVGDEGGISEYFLSSIGSDQDFEVLLAAGDGEGVPGVTPIRPANKAQQRRADRVRKRVRLHDVVYNFTHLQASGGRLVGHCPFHSDSSRSFSVYPATDTYSCSICEKQGDVIAFLMDKESMTLGQALEALECFEVTHEFYGTGS